MAQEALKLVPIVTGAILAIAAGGITQYFAHRWGQSREREKLLRGKAERADSTAKCTAFEGLVEFMLRCAEA